MRVAVRVRPVSGAERAARQKRALTVVGGRLVAVNPKALGNSGVETVALEAARLGSKHLATTFQFDDVLWGVGDGVGGVDGAEERCIDQTQLHQALGLELVESALSGVSCSCFAYGHTGTGKTYSLFGDLTHAGTRSQGITPQSGLIQRVFHDVIRLSHPSTHVFLSFLEIYNEEIHDLLGESAAPLRPREHSTFGPYVEGLTKVEAGSVEEVLSLVARGQRARATAQTAWNSASSRSHAVVTLELTPSHIDPSLLFLVRLQMVDLAGSEREPEEWGLEVRGEEREKNELKQIRRSLATLGFIIKALASGAVMRSLPYRDSTLTLLLRDALSGRNHTTMLATASPVVGCYEETMATLKYAERLHAV
ncbi:P-loop containing nucleoside triphosphate hydrolase protein, partial [Ochromonadaceae sp. CCMP2298]